MRVIQQLTQYFWNRGELSPQQADYLVIHGYVNDQWLDGYHGSIISIEDEQLDSTWDSLEDLQVRLDRDRSHHHGRRSGRNSDQATLDQVLKSVSDVLAERVETARQVVKNTQQPERVCTSPTWRDFVPVANELRRLFCFEMDHAVDAIRSRPQLLSSIWRILDPTDFAAIANDRQLHGAAVNALRALLSVKHRRELGSYRWLLKYDEIGLVADLVEIWHIFLRVLKYMHDCHFRLLHRAIAFGVEPQLFWALVLIYNARRVSSYARSRHSTGTYLLTQRPKWREWLHAIELAKAIDAKAMDQWLKPTNAEGISPDERAPDTVARNLMPSVIECPVGWHAPTVT